MEVCKTIDQQQQTAALERMASLATQGWGGGLKCILGRKIFAHDSVVVKTQNCSARMEAS